MDAVTTSASENYIFKSIYLQECLKGGRESVRFVSEEEIEKLFLTCWQMKEKKYSKYCYEWFSLADYLHVSEKSIW